MLSEKTCCFERMTWRWNRASTSLLSCCDAQFCQATLLSDAAVGTRQRELTKESLVTLVGVLVEHRNLLEADFRVHDAM